jgi:hypothetical protein
MPWPDMNKDTRITCLPTASFPSLLIEENYLLTMGQAVSKSDC